MIRLNTFKVIVSNLNLLFDYLEQLPYKLASKGLCIRNNESKLMSLKNKYAGRRAIIIGNGPSLNKIDLDLLKDEITIASNCIFLKFDDTKFRPTFYTVEDRLVAEDRASSIMKLDGMIKIIPYDLKKFIKSDSNSIYINFVRHYKNFPRFTSNFESIVYWGGTVSYLNMQLAYYIGISEIYLIGFDHDYKKPSHLDEQQGTVITSHSKDKNHFNENYFGPGFRWHDPMVNRMEQSYIVSKKFFDLNDTKIYNATVGGALEVFPRIEFDSLFNKE